MKEPRNTCPLTDKIISQHIQTERERIMKEILNIGLYKDVEKELQWIIYNQ